MSLNLSTRKKIVIDRFRFLLEVVIVFIGIFLFTLIPNSLFPLMLDPNTEYYGLFFFLARAVAILMAIPLSLLVTNLIIQTDKKEIILNEDINPAKNHLRLFRISGKNLKYQLFYGILLLFIIFIPFDFLIYYLIPGMIEYSVESLTTNNTLNLYLLNENYFQFLIFAIVIQFSIAVYEETLARGFLVNRGRSYFHYMSAVLISSLYFGFGHFAYFLDPISRNFPFWYPFLWFLQTFLVGIILALFIIKKRWLFPVIFAHAFNNIISAHTLWNYPNSFFQISFYLYFPLLILSLILFITQFEKIKAAFLNGLTDLKKYFGNNKNLEEGDSDKILRILFDIIIAILIFGLSLIII